METWHSSFNPQNFLSRVNLDKLIEQNRTLYESKVLQGNTPCILCDSSGYPGILLNDKSYLCENCLHKVSFINFPQKYETAYRQYLEAKESRRIAYNEFYSVYEYKAEGTSVTIYAWVSLFLLLIHIWLLVIPAILFLVSFIINRNQNKKLDLWKEQKTEWEQYYPAPICPELRHFHDPKAQLTKTDYKILKIFNNWPGYPPFWKYLRKIVLNRDGNHCQVSGCPSRLSLHVHHKKPVSKGGEHVPDNLVTLCDFHHALEPAEGHERIWGEIKTRYFTLVRNHTRRNRTGTGSHQVKAHVRRQKLVTADELNNIKKHYSFLCPSCGDDKITISVNDEIIVQCKECHKKWSGPKELTEETGPKIAELLAVKKNKGVWKARWDMLDSRKKNLFVLLSDSKNTEKTKKRSKKRKTPACPSCGSPMVLIKPKPNQRWPKFWGCSKYRTEGCKGNRKA